MTTSRDTDRITSSNPPEMLAFGRGALTSTPGAPGAPAAPAVGQPGGDPAAGTEPLPAPPPLPAPDASLRDQADDAWSSVFGSPFLASDLMTAAVDGETIYVGGNFTYGFAGMANDTYLRIARWDGSGWHSMGKGLDGAVHAIVVVGGDVYVGGEFTVAGGNVAASRLAKWDGESWSAVAGGVSDPDRTYGTAVRALACDGRTLWVGGTFTRAGDLPARSLAALDLTTGTWSDAGGGVAASYTTEPGEVRALTLRGTDLFVGGSFDTVGDTPTTAFASLDTRSGRWRAYGAGLTDNGMQGAVNAIGISAESGEIYVGGRFTHAGDLRTANLAVLRGNSFATLGDVSGYSGGYAEVLDLAVAGESLYIAGTFITVGNAAASHWARFDGKAWSQPAELDNTAQVLAATGNGGVLVLGLFMFSGNLRVLHGGVWNGAGWELLGQGVTSDPYSNGTVHAVVPTGTGAFVGGLFDQVGQLPAGSVARWTGTEWDTMAGGLRSGQGHGQAFAMLALGTDVYVAGSFQTAGGMVVNNIARWDGTAWSPLGEGLDGAAFAMTSIGGRLYVGGTFNLAGRLRVGHLACWDPAARAWSQVGGSPTYDHDIRALGAIGDRWLVVGGTFTRFFHNNVTIVDGLWGMALFDTARPPSDDVLAGYHLLEGMSRYGAPGWVDALRVVGGDLYAGGWFDVAGIMALGDKQSPGFPCANIAVWHFAGDGTWEGAGGTDARVQALAEVDGTVAAGGWFSTAGSVPAARVGRYDPAVRTWSTLGSGLADGARGGSWAYALAQSPESGLWVGGEFPTAGAAPSANLALWTATRGGG